MNLLPLLKRLFLGLFLIAATSGVLLYSDRGHRNVDSQRESGPKRWSVHLIEYVNVLDSEEAEQGIREGLREAGLAEGRDFTFKIRNAQSDMATLGGLVDAAVQEGADLIMTLSTPTLQAAIKRARGLPVVFTYVANPVAAGAGKSDTDHLPNVTGVYTQSAPVEMLQALRQILPHARTVGTLYVPAEVNMVFQRDEMLKAAKQLGFQVEVIGVSTTAEVSDAALALCSRKIDAICQIPGNLTTVAFSSVAQAAQKARIPVFGMQSAQAQQGAALCVSRDYHDAGRDAGKLAARVMRGADPGQIPFQVVLKTTVLVNPTAVALYGLQIPPALLKMAKMVK